MKTYVYTLNLKNDPELIIKYLEHHQAVWPEVVASVQQAGILGDRVYRLGTRLVLVLDVQDDFDPQRDLPKYTGHLRAKEWDTLMRTFQEPVLEAKVGEWWALMENIFDLNEHK
jgi:Uncharacterized conserved protein